MTDNEIETQLLVQKKLALTKFGMDYAILYDNNQPTHKFNILINDLIIELESFEQQAQAMYSIPKEPNFKENH